MLDLSARCVTAVGKHKGANSGFHGEKQTFIYRISTFHLINKDCLCWGEKGFQSGHSAPYPGPNSVTLFSRAAFTALIFSSSSDRLQAWRTSSGRVIKTDLSCDQTPQETQREKTPHLRRGCLCSLVQVTLRKKHTKAFQSGAWRSSRTVGSSSWRQKHRQLTETTLPVQL